MERHVFAICAYGDSPYLGECIRSLRAQTAESGVILCTSTPSPYIAGMAERYHVPLFVREGESNIREDWLFAWKQADAELVTIAHQDDRYAGSYAETLLRCYERYPDMTVFASDYVTLAMTGKRTAASAGPEGGAVRLVRFNKVWLVKKLLRLPLRFKRIAHWRWIKRSALIFGNSVCCPSCTYNKGRIGDQMFNSRFDFALDWDNLYELAGKPGRFVCVERPLIAYRVHAGAATKACIQDHRRTEDEIAMFRKIWPDPVVRLLMRFYKKAYDAYQ